MTISYWARLDSPAGLHLYALHDEAIQDRAEEIQAAAAGAGQPITLTRAVTRARGEAFALAVADQQWPQNWAETEEHWQSLLSAPPHPDLPVDGWHWQDEMPDLP